MRVQDLSAQADQENLTSFYISFSDLMVLLGVFFLMLLSMSKVDIGSFEKVRTSFSGSTKGTLIELANELKEIVEVKPGVPGVQVHLASDGVRVDLDTGALFETGSSRVRGHALDVLKPILKRIKASGYSLDVEGHTDDLPMYRFIKLEDERVLETNWSLSGRRAATLIHFLLKEGFKQKRLRLIGYASNSPLKSIKGLKGSQLDQARAENRRVSLLIK